MQTQAIEDQETSASVTAKAVVWSDWLGPIPHDQKVKVMRERIIAYLKAQGGTAERAALKAHLGIERLACNGWLDKALKTKKIVALHGSGEVAPGLYLRIKPVVAYRLARA